MQVFGALRHAVAFRIVRITLIVVVACGALAGGLFFWLASGSVAAVASEEARETSAPESAPESGRFVETTLVGRSCGYSPIPYPATVAASRKVQLAFRVGGPLVELAIHPGDRVKKGDVLMRIDPRDFENAVKATQSALAAAKAKYAAMKNGAREEDINALEAKIKAAEAVRDYVMQQYGRMERLVEQRAVARSQFDSIQSELAGAKAGLDALHEELTKAKAGARLEDLQAMEAEISGLETRLQTAKDALADTVLVAPFDGLVTKHYFENYEMVESGKPAVAMHDVATLEIKASLPEKELIHRDFRTPFPVEVRFHAAGENTYQASFKEIDTDANTQTRTYDVVFAMDAPPDVSIFPGMTAEVRIPSCDPDKLVLSVPSSAVVTDTQGNDFVWVLRDDGAERRRITKGRLLQGNRYEVIEGLAEGEEIVTAGAKFVYRGKSVSKR